jgi:hypothetical protein
VISEMRPSGMRERSTRRFHAGIPLLCDGERSAVYVEFRRKPTSQVKCATREGVGRFPHPNIVAPTPITRQPKPDGSVVADAPELRLP